MLSKQADKNPFKYTIVNHTEKD